MKIDESLYRYAEETRQFNAVYEAAMKAQPLGFASAGDALRTRALLDAAVEDLPEGVLQPKVMEVGRPDAPVTVRVFEPAHVDAVYVHFHGGAWIIGSARASDARSAELATNCRVAVVSVEYRMVPEARPPAQVEDALAVIDWLRREGSSRFGTDRLIMAGESAGATLAVLTMLQLRDSGIGVQDVVAAVLSYGLFDVAGSVSQRLHPSLATFEDAQSLVYPGRSKDQLREASISPLYADLRGLPAALFSVGDADALLDDTTFMFERWTAAGNDAELAVYPDSLHGFDAFPTKMAVEARRRVDAFVAERIAGQTAGRPHA